MHDFSSLTRVEFPDEVLMRISKEQQLICAIACDLVATSDGENDIEFYGSAFKINDATYAKSLALAHLIWADQDMVLRRKLLRIVTTARYAEMLASNDYTGFEAILPLYEQKCAREAV